MKTPAVWITPLMTIKDAAKLMCKMNVGALPILKNDQILGIITRTDVLNTIPKK